MGPGTARTRRFSSIAKRAVSVVPDLEGRFDDECGAAQTGNNAVAHGKRTGVRLCFVGMFRQESATI